MREPDFGSVKGTHRYAWLWEPMEAVPGFELKSMFGWKMAYVNGNLMLGFAAKQEPWRGVLVCTDRQHHAALMKQFAALKPHPVLTKWLHLSEEHADFERVAGQLVDLAMRRDPRIGVPPKSKKR